MNTKVIVTFIVGVIVALISIIAKVDVPVDVRDGFVVGIITLIGIFSHTPSDPKGVQTSIAALLFAISWVASIIFHIQISDSIKQMAGAIVTGLIGTMMTAPQQQTAH